MKNDIGQATEKTYLGTMQAEITKLRQISDELSYLANSFQNTGNLNMHETLNNISIDIADSENKIDKAVGGEIDRQFKQVQQSSANMINACLSVSKMKQESI